MRKRRLFPVSLSGLLLVGACASPPPPTPPIVPPAASSVAATPPPAIEEPLAPGEMRCGIDDGPVPIGERDEVLPRDDTDRFAVARPIDNQAAAVVAKRAMADDFDFVPPVDAAKARAAIRWVLGEGLATAPAFESRAQSCRDLADLDDTGAQAFSVRVAAGGAPLTVRPTGARAPSRYATCLATSLCALGPQLPGSPARRIDARFVTTLTPPVFTGTVSLSLRGDRTPITPARGPSVAEHSRRGRRVPMPPQPPPTPADRAYIEKMTKAAEVGALACAKRTPPNGALFVATGPLTPAKAQSPYKKIDVAMAPPRAPASQAAFQYQAAMTKCFTEAMQAVLIAPPKSFSTTGKVFASAQYSTGPEPPPPATP